MLFKWRDIDQFRWPLYLPSQLFYRRWTNSHVKCTYYRHNKWNFTWEIVFLLACLSVYVCFGYTYLNRRLNATNKQCYKPKQCSLHNISSEHEWKYPIKFSKGIRMFHISPMHTHAHKARAFVDIEVYLGRFGICGWNDWEPWEKDSDWVSNTNGSHYNPHAHPRRWALYFLWPPCRMGKNRRLKCACSFNI